MTIRAGSVADLDAVMTLMDDAVAWLVSQGRTGQWGTEPWSCFPERIEHFRKDLEQCDLWLAEIDGVPVGAMILGSEPMPYVQPIEEPEFYVRLLVTGSAYRGRGIGQALIDKARDEAKTAGIDLIRVDCYAGDDAKLPAQYVRLGFTPTERIMVRETIPVQVSQIRLSEA